MSDGPYKSLPMRKAWKDVAEYAHKPAFRPELDQVMCSALHSEIDREAGKPFINTLGKILVDAGQGDLFSDQAIVEIGALRQVNLPGSMREAILEHAEAALNNGYSGEEALAESIQNAAMEIGEGYNRQIEEHYHRDALNQREHEKSVSVRANLDKSLASERMSRIGLDVVDVARGEIVDTKITKAVDLDAGPVMA